MALRVRALPFTFAAHVLAIAGLILVLVWTLHFRGGLAWSAKNKSLIFNIHPVLMLIGFIVIGGEGNSQIISRIRCEEVDTSCAPCYCYIILGIVGICAAFKYHNESAIANLYSLHSWLGIGIIVLYGIQWIYGFVLFFYPGGSSELRSESLPWHVAFGLFVYTLALGNAALGFLEKLTFLETSGIAKYGSEAFLVNFLAVITILFGAFVLLSVQSQHPTAEDDHSYSAI
uniref:ascorbate ferrireductase (transmembrane) n=1 Tax=Fagus sylvatica TaxID=28930 RepID=A0A2N9GSX3_FAGSY